MKTITINLPENLIKPLIMLVDAGVRANGLEAAAAAVMIQTAIENGVKLSASSAHKDAPNPPPNHKK